MFGGNSNWRGPIWAPINALIVRALLQMYTFYGDDFRVECPTGSGQHMNLYEVAQEIANRLGHSSCATSAGAVPSTAARGSSRTTRTGATTLFYEYFHGDNGAGLGASHQTGWTAIIPTLFQILAQVPAAQFLAEDRPLAAAQSVERAEHPAGRAAIGR